jgi:hypothetical protein
MKKLLLPIVLFSTLAVRSQLVIDNATFFIDNGAVVTVQGDVTSNVNIQAAGTGKLRLAGTTTQNLNLNGKDVPNLQIDNSSASVVLTGAARVTTNLDFANGKIQLGANDLTIASAATVTGAATGKFAETNGAGFVKQELPAAGSVVLPVGNGNNYTPVNYTTTGGTYSASTFVAAKAVGAVHPAKHPRSTDYLNNYWTLKNNIAGATITAVGNYVNPTSVTGSQALIVSLLYNGTTWALGSAQGPTSVTGTVTANGQQDIYGSNKFILSAPKVILQGAYAGAGLQNDLLRNASGVYSVGTLPLTNLIPTADPYRSAPYSANYFHVANDVAEAISTDVLKDQPNPNDNIVDWVFLELRTNATPSTVIQTRSALLQRDGDIVDIDGVSPIYFKNVDAANYNISIRHRNHLAVRTATATGLNLTTPLSKIDYTTAAANNLNGFAANLGGGVFGLYAGNSNINSNVRISGATVTASDYLAISSALGSSPLLLNQYSAADLNLDRRVRISGATAAASDYLFLSSVLGSSPLINQPAQ